MTNILKIGVKKDIVLVIFNVQSLRFLKTRVNNIQHDSLNVFIKIVFDMQYLTYLINE